MTYSNPTEMVAQVRRNQSEGPRPAPSLISPPQERTAITVSLLCK